MATSSSSVRVTFVDDATGALLGVVDVSTARLPASFGPATTLHLGDDEWEVVRAEPSDAAEYAAQGALRLSLRHLRRTPSGAAAAADDSQPTALRHPTVATLPEAGEPRPADDVLELREDDWRQIELVTEQAADAVAAELGAIERVRAQHRAAGGFFSAARTRAGMDAPLAGVSLGLDELRSAFRGPRTDYAAVALAGRDRAVADGFAFRTAGGLTVYGQAPGGRVTVLGLRSERDRPGPPPDAPTLATLRRAHGLLLVDWCARTVVRPGPAPRAS